MNYTKIHAFLLLFFLGMSTLVVGNKNYKKLTKNSTPTSSFKAFKLTKPDNSLIMADNPAALAAPANPSVVKHTFTTLCLFAASGVLLKIGNSLIENSHSYVGGIVTCSAVFAFIASRIPAESD